MTFYSGSNQTSGTGLFSSVGNFFSNIFKPNSPTPNPTQPVLTQIPTAGGYGISQNGATFGADLPSAYQVKPGDTDLAGVANQMGVPLQQLVDANEGARTLPPVGSYMAVYRQSEQTSVPGGFGNQLYQQSERNGVPVTAGMGAANPSAYYQGAGAQGPQLPTMQQAQTMLRQGIDPPVLHAGLVTALNLTHDQMVANGYTLDAATNTYKKAGTGTGAQAPGQEQPRTTQQQIQTGVVPQGQQFQRVKASENYGAFVAQEQAFLNAQRWDPERKKYVSIRQLLNEGKLNIRDPQARFQYGQVGGGGGGRGLTRKPVYNTPAQQLSLMLGSG